MSTQQPPKQQNALQLDARLDRPGVLQGRGRGMVPLKTDLVVRNLAPLGAAGASNLVDHGGRVLSSVNVTTIFWGAHWISATGATELAHMNSFFDFILTSDYMNMLAEYSRAGRTISFGQRVGTATVSGSEPGTALATGGREVTDDQIRTELQALINAGTVPAVTRDSLYFVYLPPNVTVVDGTDRSCTKFCGYHKNINGSIFYAVEPYITCAGCSFGSNVTDSLTKVSSHELAEAVTDPLGDAWFADDAKNNEIGDLCNLDTASLGGFLVQPEWSNGQAACVLTPPGPWRHLGKIHGHPLEADFDCSGLQNAARSVTLADVDGDGHAEVVLQIDAAGSGGNDFWVMKWNATTRSWAHLSPIPGHPLQADLDCSGLGNAARSVNAGDVDGDGRAELIMQIDAAGSGGNDFWVLKYDPVHRSWNHLSPIAGHPLQADFDCSGLRNAARSVSVGDVDGDGHAEVVVQIDASGSGGNDFWVMKYNPAARNWFHLSPIGGHPLQADFDCSGLQNAARTVRLADVDGDGHAEVIVQIDAANSGGNDFWVMKFNTASRSWGHLSPIPGHPLGADFDCSGLPNAARSVTVGDVDGDGHAEVIVQIDAANSGGNDFWAMKFDSAARHWGHLSPIAGHPLGADFDCSGLPNAARSVSIGDVDGDGLAEVIVQIDAAGSGGNDFWVMKYHAANRQWTHFSPIPGHPLQADFDASVLGNGARSVRSADVDGDGRAEVVLQIDGAGSGGNDFWVMEVPAPARRLPPPFPLPPGRVLGQP